MGHAWLRRFTVGLILAVGSCASAQEVGSRVPESAESAGAGTVEPSAAEPGGSGEQGQTSSAPSSPQSLLDRLLRVVSQEEDPDGPINTDRPTFTPANTVVPRGRLQFESGWTFNGEKTSQTRADVYDFPELGIRYGLMNRVEFRTQVGFKWQLFPGDEKRKWIPTTALITAIYAPTGGTSPYSSETVQPHVNLIYGWTLTKKLTLSGSTGYLGIREQAIPYALPRSDNFQLYHQSIVAFFAPAERTTLFYEWYVFTFTHAPDNRPTHFMDGGLLYRLSPNVQVDIRAGFGLTGRPDDFFTGTGFSVRF
jgi:hypothetical protein